MAFNFHNHQDEDTVMSEINVTPFIDVMLVLLIIFMIVAPLATVDIKIDLPASSAKDKVQRPHEPIYVSLKDDSSLYVGNESISKAELEQKLDKLSDSNKDTVIFLRGDKQVRYELLIELMNELRKANYLQVALIGLEQAN